jgi:serine/threonine-protein kinase
MGVVVAARHLKLDERVAIKFLHPEALENAEAVARFDREARAAVKIKSEHVARTIDVGTLDNGAPYMIMEYLDGEDLARWLQSKGPIPIDLAIEFVLQACEAMADAHSLGIVHRDLKPSNLFCIRRSDGLLAIKVLDFGISKISAGVFGPAMDMTQTGAVMGSPLYMSPEQMRSARSVDARSDIWAIGVILYELLAGRLPFRGETLPEVCMSISTQPTPSIRAVRPDVPPGLEMVIATCLKKDRRDRYSNVAELGVALAPFGPRRARALAERISRVIMSAGLSTSALALPPSSDPTEPAASATIASWGRTGPGIRRRAGLVSVAVIVLFGLFGAAVRWLMPETLSRWLLLAPSAAPPLATSHAPTLPRSAVAYASTFPETANISLPPSATPSTPSASTLASKSPVAVSALPRAVPAAQSPTPRARPNLAAPRIESERPAPVASAGVPPSASAIPANRSRELGGRL